MAKTLKYVDVVLKKNGKTYFYFRRKGQRTSLPGPYNSPEFLQTYSVFPQWRDAENRNRR